MNNKQNNGLSNTRANRTYTKGSAYILTSMIFVLVVVLSAVSVTVFAGAPMPDIPKGKGKQCVEDTEYMRKNHMELLLHQRDETVHRGIRTKKHSLKECIACHVVTDSNNKAISVANPKHFCRQCHDYASVKIDCFECHASKPAEKSATFDVQIDNLRTDNSTLVTKGGLL